MTNAAAIILCAGKGTRMNDDSKNKVCFDCAGTPVIRRIIDNMRAGGVGTFVIVIGHQAYSVMDCLDGIDGVIYAYQKEQKGTGHAALCGLKALSAVGYDGPVIVSMGDKIIDTHVISELISRSRQAKAVWGVQPTYANYNGGRVLVSDGKPYGVIELADASLMALADLEPEQYREKLDEIKLNPKKAEKVIKKALAEKPSGTREIAGKVFTADEVLGMPYANAGLYCFDVKTAVDVINGLGSNNAQGEIYLTDALEVFAERDSAVLYEVARAEDMLTYSTKPELREMSRYFMRTAGQFIADIDAGKLDGMFADLYRDDDCDRQKKRYAALLSLFIEKYGDKKVVITRAPGRINLMGRHIDHRGGSENVMVTDKDTVLVVSPRDDDTVNMTNVDRKYPKRSFEIGRMLESADHSSWLDYLENKNVVRELANSRGDWSNYVKAAVLRAQLDNDMPLCGMDIAVSGTIPVAAGLSSSSSIVVAVMEAVVGLNCLNILDDYFINLCAEGEWFVGSRGGAGDHAAMKCCKRDSVIHLGFKPFRVGDPARFSDKYSVIVANSMIQAKKSEGSKDIYNARVAAYEFILMILKAVHPEYDLREFRDIAKIRPYSRIYEILKSVPETMTRGGLKALLPQYRERIEQLFSTHADPKIYDLRGVALYGAAECVRAERFMDALNEGDYVLLGDLMKISHDGDRIREVKISDEVLDSLAEINADIAFQGGAYCCSTSRIDELCDLLNKTEGVLGSEISGAGLGGCVVVLAEKDKVDGILETINREYYDRYGYEHSANVYSAANGSSVVY